MKIYWNENQYENLDKIKHPKTSDIGKSFFIEGFVQKVNRKKYKTICTFKCSKCATILKEQQYSNYVEAATNKFRLIKPHSCYRDQGGCMKSGSSTNFITLSYENEFECYDEIKLIPAIDKRFRINCILDGNKVDKLWENDRIRVRIKVIPKPKKTIHIISNLLE